MKYSIKKTYTLTACGSHFIPGDNVIIVYHGRVRSGVIKSIDNHYVRIENFQGERYFYGSYPIASITKIKHYHEGMNINI